MVAADVDERDQDQGLPPGTDRHLCDHHQQSMNERKETTEKYQRAGQVLQAAAVCALNAVTDGVFTERPRTRSPDTSSPLATGVERGTPRGGAWTSLN